MDHREYIRVVEGSQYAVLMVHGIVGSPVHFRDLLPVIPEDWSVYNLLLAGHGGSVSDFAAASMEQWKRQVADTLKLLLSRHEKVLFVGHSMGTLFGIQGAVDYPDRIAGLFLLGVPLRPWVRGSTMLTCLQVTRGNLNSAAAQSMYGDTGVGLEKQLWKYLGWIPRFLELLAECRRVRKLLPRLAVPTQAYQSQTDELVSIRTCKDLEGHPYIQTTVLSHSGHFSYGPEDTRLLQQRLGEVIARMQGENGLTTAKPGV